MEIGIPKDSLLQASVIINNANIYHDAGSFQGRVFEDLAQQAAITLASSVKTTKTVGDYSTEYRLQVYCISPDELHRVIQEEAMRLGRLQTVTCVPDVNAELLAALEAFVHDFDRRQVRLTEAEKIDADLAWFKAVDNARAAIAKAKGGAA